MSLYFANDPLLALIQDPDSMMPINQALLKNVLYAAVHLERQPADTKEGK